MLNSDWLKTKLRLIVQDLRLIVTFMQRARCARMYRNLLNNEKSIFFDPLKTSRFCHKAYFLWTSVQEYLGLASNPLLNTYADCVYCV